MKILLEKMEKLKPLDKMSQDEIDLFRVMLGEYANALDKELSPKAIEYAQRIRNSLKDFGWSRADSKASNKL